MPAQPLSEIQKQDAARLRRVWEKYKQDQPEFTQEKLASACGWKTQGSVSQYMLGRIPLNLSALLKFSASLGITPAVISPSLAAQIPNDGETDIARRYAKASLPVKDAIDDLVNLPPEEAEKLAQILSSIRASFKPR